MRKKAVRFSLVSMRMVAVLTHTVIAVEEVFEFTFVHRKPKLMVT